MSPDSLVSFPMQTNMRWVSEICVYVHISFLLNYWWNLIYSWMHGSCVTYAVTVPSLGAVLGPPRSVLPTVLAGTWLQLCKVSSCLSHQLPPSPQTFPTPPPGSSLQSLLITSLAFSYVYSSDRSSQHHWDNYWPVMLWNARIFHVHVILGYTCK